MKDEAKTKKQLIQELEALRERCAGLEKLADEQRRTEESIVDLASFPDLNPNPFVEADFAGTVHYFNLAAKELFPDLQTLGIQHPWLEDWDSMVAIFKSATKVSHVREILTGNVWYEQTIYYVPDSRRVRIYGHDITERKQAEEKIRESERKYHEFYEGSRDGFVRVDMEGNIKEFNQAYMEMLGYSREELRRLTYIDLTPEKWHSMEEKIVKDQILKEAFSRVYEKEYTRKDGTVFPVSLRVYLIKDANGKPSGMWAFVRDITERKKMEEELRRSRDELEIRVQERTAELGEINQELQVEIAERRQAEKMLVEQSKILEGFFTSTITPLVFLDRDFNFIRVNEAYAKACQRDVSEFPGRNHFEFYPSDAKAIFEQVVQTKVPYQAVARPFAFPDHPEWGVTYWDWTLTPLLDDKGEVEFLVFSLEDVTERKRAQEAVVAERQRLNDVLEMLPAYLVLLTPDYHVPFANRFFRERFGEAQGRRCFEYLFGRSEPCEICETYTVLKTMAPHVWEWTGPDGRDYYVSDFPFTDTDGSTLILEVGIDVTKRKRAEEALRAASLYTRSLIEASPDPLVTISPDGKVTDVNRATELVTGVSREHLIGTDFSDYFTEPEEAREGYKEAFSKGFVRDYPLAIRHTSGSLTDVLYNATVYRDEAGEVQGVFAAARDITKRKQAEKALKVASLYTRSLIEASLDPLVTISADGKVMDVNEATELVTGVSREHLIGSDFSSYFTDPQKAKEGYEEVFSKGFVRDYPLAIRHTSGRVTEVLYNATVYRNEAGEVQGVFAAARDITERKRAEEALRKSDEQRRQLYSQLLAAQENERRRVARELHDGLGQYLTAIKFRVESFLQEISKSRMKTKAKSLEAVIPMVQESVREIRRIQTDLRPSILDDLGILSTISWFCREFQTTYSHIRIEKEIDIREENVPDSLKMVIYRIMQEALNNISKHGQADLVHLAFRKTDGGLELSIQDNGQGFDMPKVLSVEKSKRGLGLSSMRERAEHSGGSLLIESAEGKGTLIRAVWPM